MNKITMIKLVLSYIAVTFALAYIWHITLFGALYSSLGQVALRVEPIIPLGLLAIICHALMLTYLFVRFFPTDPTLKTAMILALSAGVFITAYAAFSVPAKFALTPAIVYVFLEASFGLIHYTLIGFVFYIISKRGIS